MVTLIVCGVIVLLFALILVRMPVAIALALSGAVGLVLLKSLGYASNTLGSAPFTQTATFTLTVIPMFILMGMFAMRARIAEQIFAIANFAMRRIPGGLGAATVMACAGLAAVSGSSIGTAATMARLSVREMMRYGYPASLASATVAIAGTLGVIIPPSTFLVLYAILTGESVAQMLAAGVIPGLLSALGYITYILLIGRRQIVKPDEPELAEVVSEARDAAAAQRAQASGNTLTAVRTSVGRSSAPLTAQLPAVTRLPWRGLVRLAILFLIILGGMYSGLFTTIESAAIAAFSALLMVVFELWKDGVAAVWAGIKGALLDTAKTSSMVLMILVGSGILSTFLIVAGVPQSATNWVSSLEIPAVLTMALLLLCLLPLGTALDELAVLIITIPIIYPIAIELGYDGVWLGLMIVKLTAIGMVTPPVGMTCFVVSGTTGVKIETVFKGVTPFVVMDLIVTAVLFAFPALVMFLPNLVNPMAG